MSEINETFEPQRLSPSEVAEIEQEAMWIVWWSWNYPVAYRYFRKFMRYVGVEL